METSLEDMNFNSVVMLRLYNHNDNGASAGGDMKEMIFDLICDMEVAYYVHEETRIWVFSGNINNQLADVQIIAQGEIVKVCSVNMNEEVNVGQEVNYDGGDHNNYDAEQPHVAAVETATQTAHFVPHGMQRRSASSSTKSTSYVNTSGPVKTKRGKRKAHTLGEGNHIHTEDQADGVDNPKGNGGQARGEPSSGGGGPRGEPSSEGGGPRGEPSSGGGGPRGEPSSGGGGPRGEPSSGGGGPRGEPSSGGGGPRGEQSGGGELLDNGGQTGWDDIHHGYEGLADGDDDSNDNGGPILLDVEVHALRELLYSPFHRPEQWNHPGHEMCEEAHKAFIEQLAKHISCV